MPTDQAPAESFLGHITTEWPQRDTIESTAVLAPELDAIREQYNTVRLHAGIRLCHPPTTSTPAIRYAGRQGLKHAGRGRIAYHRKHNHQPLT